MGEGQAFGSDGTKPLNESPAPAPNGPSREELQRRLGELLRSTRQQKKLRAEEVAEKLRISRTFLEALEAGDWARLPEEVYARGFARQYAQLLGIEREAEELLKQLKHADIRLTPPATYPSAPTVPPKRWAQIAALGFVIVLVLGLWLGMRSPEKPPPPPVPPPSFVEPQPAPPKPALSQTKEAAQPASPASALPAAQPAKRHRYAVVARGGPLWVEFRDLQGALLARKLLADGETLSVEQEGPVRVRVGDAARAEIRIDDDIVVPAGTLGPPERVRERVLEPSQKSGQRAAADQEG